MHNWWLATLEHAGVITHEEAEKISSEIRIRIHRDDYVQAYREIDTILGDKLEGFNKIKSLESRLKVLEAKFDADVKQSIRNVENWQKTPSKK